MDNIHSTDISRALSKSDLTLDQLREINAVLKVAYDRAQRKARLAFRVGDRVSAGAYGEGVIDNIGPKNVMIKLDDGRRLRSSPSLIEKI
jgi:hypothetical protein